MSFLINSCFVQKRKKGVFRKKHEVSCSVLLTIALTFHSILKEHKKNCNLKKHLNKSLHRKQAHICDLKNFHIFKPPNPHPSQNCAPKEPETLNEAILCINSYSSKETSPEFKHI